MFVLTRCLLQLLDPALCCLVQAPRLRVPEKRHTNTRLFESMIFWQQLLESLVLSIYQWTQSPHTAHTPFFLIPCFRWSPGILRASLWSHDSSGFLSHNCKHIGTHLVSGLPVKLPFTDVLHVQESDSLWGLH